MIILGSISFELVCWFFILVDTLSKFLLSLCLFFCSFFTIFPENGSRWELVDRHPHQHFQYLNGSSRVAELYEEEVVKENRLLEMRIIALEQASDVETDGAGFLKQA